MNNKKLLIPLCLAPAMSGIQAFAQNGNAGEQGRPDILFLLTDDQSFNTIRSLGNGYADTPNMDELVRSGVCFTQTHVMGGFNGAISQPSRAMLLTGCGLMSLHRNGSIIPEGDTTFPEYFRSLGYTTFGTGKWHSDKAAFNRSFSTGANIFFGGMHFPGKDEAFGHVRPFLNQYDPTGKYDNGKYIDEEAHTFSSELYANAAIDFINANKDSKTPILTYVAFTSPHDPRNIHPDYGRKFRPDEVALPKNFMTRHPFNNGDMNVRDEKLLPTPRDPEAVRQEVAFYYGMVNEVDKQIGRIIDALKQSGRYDNTIIVFAADNGLAVGSHGLLGKQNLYEESVRVPCVICGPGIPKNQKRDTYTYLYDLFPTMCELSGVPIPERVQGKSLRPAIESKRAVVRDELFLVYMNLQRAVKKDGYKLVLYNVNGERHPQLFNLEKDPFELENLYDNPKYAKLRDELTERLETLMRESGDICDPSKPDWGYPGMLTGEQLRQVKP
ncbi:MAG: sulfatase-like hydrolase/transferase [Candidatus Cryptobacteroides sp.]